MIWETKTVSYLKIKFKYHIQSKRWEITVFRQEIQKFTSALQGQQAKTT